MTIEAQLERIATALENLAAAPAPTVKPAETKKAAPKKKKPEAAPAEAAAPAPAPAPAPAAGDAPFSNQHELNAYITTSYKEMGPEKGAQIGGILQQMGVDNVTKITVEQYPDFYKAIETLKAS
jgi:uncharacterized membrane protein